VSKSNARQQLQAKLKALIKQQVDVEDQIAELDEVESGDRPSPEIAAAIRSQKFSYTVEFVRRNGTTKGSQRRFSSSKEAGQHGRRFAKKHRHSDYHVVKVAKRANAWINWTTGKTNPVI